jgi:ABC-type nitrate/sulfonate/bicarbonate transport system substrate-binding protein
MNRNITCVLILTAVIVAACSPQAPTLSSPAATPSTTAARKSGTIRFSLLGSANVRDVPWLMALDSLKAQGYTVEVTTFAKSNLIPPALSQEDIDVASANATIAWAAIAQGADIRTVVSAANTSFYFIAKEDIQSCRDLDGKAIAFSTRQSVGYVMFEEYLNQHCAGVMPEVMLISESRNRVVALQAGEIEGAYLELEDWLQLQQMAPGKFHVLIDFGKEFPQVKILTFNVRREWAEQNQEMVKDFIRALLIADRGVLQDPQLLRDGIVKYLSLDAAQAQELADVYLAAKIWDPNGGVTPEIVQSTLDFLSAGGILPAGSKVEDVANLSYLNAVLDEIGRQ